MKRRTAKAAFPWVAGSLIILGLALRLPFFTARSLWFDEAFSWRLINVPLSEFVERASADVHPVLYYVLLWFWMIPARTVGPEGTLAWMRLLSVLLSTATVAAMVGAGRVLFRSRWVGAVAGLFTAVNAFQIQYAWEARMYALGTVLTPLAMVFLARAVFARASRRTWRAGLGFGCSLGLLLHVHYYALFSWLALGAAKLLYFLHRMRFGVRSVLRSVNFRAAEVGFWLSAILFLPWLPVFLSQVGRVEEAFWIPKFTLFSVPGTLARLFWGGADHIPPRWAVLASVAALVLVVLSLRRGRSFGDLVAALSFVLPIVLSAAVSYRTSVFLDRYFLFASLGLILVLARTLSFLPRRWATSSVGVLASLGLLSVVQMWTSLDVGERPGARAAANFLTTEAPPHTTVVVSSPFVYFPMSFHLGCRPSGTPCFRNFSVSLFSETGELAHFAGAPILRSSDIAGPAVFRDSSLGGLLHDLWVIDTTGFGGSRLAVPTPYVLQREESFPELFAYQGEIIVRHYIPG